jgi:hypothetical protein
LAEEIAPDFVFLATRNPVGEAVKFYYRAFAKISKLPVLVLSQNGLSAGGDAREALKEALGADSEKVKIIRLSLFNPIAAVLSGETFCVSYSTPVQLCYGVHSGGAGASDLREVFSNTKIDAAEVAAGDTRNMEYSKLFLNLIGMASAVRGKSVKEGFNDPEIFADEMKVIREYAKSVKKAGGKFLTFPNYSYPVGIIVWGLTSLPLPVFSLFRSRLAGIVGSKRDNKPKDIAEIDYYNGDVVKLARKFGVCVPANEKILAEGKKLLKEKQTAAK